MATDVVLITGASGGIGGAVARAFSHTADTVILGYHTNRKAAKALEEELAQNGCTVKAMPLDVSRSEQVDRLFETVENKYGAITTLVNCAGTAQQKMFCDITEKDWDGMFEVHVKGTFLCCKRALGNMVRQKSGSIVNLSSIWGEVGASCEVHYSAAKAAVIGLTKALAKEVGPSGVRVNCIAPGAVDTAMMQDFTDSEKAGICDHVSLGRLADPKEIADVIMFLSSGAASYITGQVISADGGWL